MRATARISCIGGVDRPWFRPGMGATDGDLTRLAAWCARWPDVDKEVVLDGVSLLGPARADLDQVEAAMLFAARAAGVTWSDIAGALGLGSAQVAQQRFERVLARTDEVEGGGWCWWHLPRPTSQRPPALSGTAAIPAVVAVPNGMSVLMEGSVVRVDGSCGVVAQLEPTGECP